MVFAAQKSTQETYTERLPLQRCGFSTTTWVWATRLSDFGRDEEPMVNSAKELNVATVGLRRVAEPQMKFKAIRACSPRGAVQATTPST